MSRGFTLVEIMVVVVIMAAVSLYVTIAYPHARAEQKLTLAEQTLQAALRAAQQSAINEERDPNCLLALPATAPQHLCSDIGVVLEPANHEIIVFADIFKPDENKYEIGSDWRLENIPFPDGVELIPSSPPITLIFQGTPPNIGLFTSGSPAEVNFQFVTLSIGTASRDLRIFSYGQVERR